MSEGSQSRNEDLLANRNLQKIKNNAKGDKALTNIVYDKVRYPGYKDLLYQKKDQQLLAEVPNKIMAYVGHGGPVEMGGDNSKVNK